MFILSVCWHLATSSGSLSSLAIDYLTASSFSCALLSGIQIRNQGNEDEAKVAFQRVHAAYQLLMKGPGYDSDEEEFGDMGFDEAFSFFMNMYATLP